MVHLVFLSETEKMDGAVEEADCLEIILYPILVGRHPLNDQDGVLIFLHKLEEHGLCQDCKNNFLKSGGREAASLVAFKSSESE